jgi:hypothetical protein
LNIAEIESCDSFFGTMAVTPSSESFVGAAMGTLTSDGSVLDTIPKVALAIAEAEGLPICSAELGSDASCVSGTAQHCFSCT